MTGVFDFLHIKQHTAGSSNELSFDVLDQRRSEADGKGRSSRFPKAPRASQGTYHGVGNSGTLAGQAEVEQRKKARHAHRLRLRVAGAVVAVALFGSGAYLAFWLHGEQVDFSGRINDLVTRLSTVDETLVKVDGLMNNPLEEAAAADRSAVLEQMPKLTTELNRIAVDAQSLQNAQLSDREAVAVGQLSEAAQSRADMLDAAGRAFRLSAESANQVAYANGVWSSVLNADQTARDAVAQANRALTEEETTASLDKTREALGGFSTALNDLQGLSKAYGVDFSDQETYLNKKIEALGHAVETSEALIAGDREKAASANDAYNEADAEAARLASALPPSIEELVRAHFMDEVAVYQERYGDARARTVQADSAVREAQK